ncbi:ABC-type multidrug transport system, ATPase component [Clostridium pasteurianum DSM 525 = ATCC 6013]|uniref:ABC-type multidrug transport system, ATPase component n=1 Tax=Clostridium pasteurianum DSM 525 = ATCC 6013 TaxID=1262449 RepID=A0A0H3J6A0_CLOPA|nr:ABC transporter ATP-binding protein [Clostridium pasteurianum]AJA48989.1 ABC-type multidrug transport system, ATPase component [Clostridium pasteurianum DSM 525 = ATCC 6013]AJA52977.1 ABC-type multidrug transport system, ATPase component [Clostridium pasteurianum DSM 525 = ATCC 6013]AOZ76196.1 antibiotic ABC transporter ATP-binding protein [Clostridium pasteurianum DSM 525 = ATCC 6013]AOZ79992.1 antibiotic ABC transporter ATP-binding protein [Clostridium pasteurianum]ELP60285.1 ABC transpor
MKVVKIENLVKKFGNTAAVDKITLDIEEGEIYGLLGPNGAGKSTTINMICGLLSPNEGTIEILEKDIRKNKIFAKKNIGIVPQDIAIYEDLTAYENVKFFSGLYGFRGSELKARVEEALEFVGLMDKAKSFPGSFSGGMKRRLNIACAIAHRPKVIIMDEPTVGIDPQSRNHILQSVKKLNEMGSTIVYTSHYMEEIEEICTRIGIVDHGKLIAEGTKEELKSSISDTNTVWVTVQSLNNFDVDELNSINGVVSVELDDNVVKISSSQDINNLDKIIWFFTDKGIHIRNVETKTPDLETVFLTLTGRKLRD